MNTVTKKFYLIRSSLRINVSHSLLNQTCILIFICYFLVSCSTKPDSKNGISTVKFEQYYLQGQQLYQVHCSNCHQKNGTGLGLVYPPLNKSDFINDNVDEVICIIKFGRRGELVVNGKRFNKVMPPPSLSNLEVAEVTTYIYNTWGHKGGLIDIKMADKIISKCSNN